MSNVILIYLLTVNAIGFLLMTVDKYKAKKNGTTQNDVFQQRQFYDRYKKDFALNHNYFYLEIPYWTENDESYRDLIDNKIKEILKEVA